VASFVSENPTFTVFGAGLAGLLMAAYLGQAGYNVRLYEMRPDPREAGAVGGRSINLALSRRGIHALDEVGILDQIRDLSIPMKGRMMHPVSGSLSFQPYGTEKDQYLNSVSRARLNQTLLESAAACPGVTIEFEQKCLDMDVETGRVTLEHTGTGETRELDTEIVIGADGAFSRVRAALERCDRFDYRQDYLEHGYKELTMPPASGGFALEPNALHIWPRRTYMMIALPNQDATFTCTLFLPFDGASSFASIRSDEEILGFFQETFPDAVPLIPDLVDQFRDNPVGSLITIRCRPWQTAGRAVLIGDAAHAVVPFYGQGINAGFEDCTVLMECIGEFAPGWDWAFRAYEERRKMNTDALADLALANFVEMRDHVGSSAFLVRKGVERTLHRFFSRWYVPLYTMVTFTRIPYAEARERARRQGRIVMGAGLAVLLALVVVLLLLLNVPG
jgi:kynurenine 3-monooxygenase